ncbi:MAG: alkaline phosphatase family protein [Acidobacteriaceae bacterium]|nr:alkaline phosphatase family protein [Acidobacteriaceae bacterium]
MSPFQKLLFALSLGAFANAQQTPRRVVFLKIDGLNADLLYRTMQETDPATGKSRLPWLKHIFAERGTVFENFYTRGISLSTPSWSMLDTGHHTVIRGNVEYDRYTGHVYDYMNFFPFYIGYARSRTVDMPGVRVLERAGIPLMIDDFEYPQVFQSFELFQRGVRWKTLEQVLKGRFSSKMFLSILENGGGPSLDESLASETEQDLISRLRDPSVLYLDFFTGSADHEGHATNQPGALLDVMKELDSLAGRLWMAIQRSPLPDQTIFIAVSDHGMNNVRGVFSQAYGLPDFFNSAEGGAHHVVTNRHQLQDYKLLGLDPLIERVITPSTVSFYLQGEAPRYPTAWLDLDGNERASVYLRNSDLNTIHILLQQLSRRDLPPTVRHASTKYLMDVIERHREPWTDICLSLGDELNALQQAISERRKAVERLPKEWSDKERSEGEDKAARRLTEQLQTWEREYTDYRQYFAHLQALLSLDLNPDRPLIRKVSELVPEMTLGDNNTVGQLQHYVTGPGPEGLVVDEHAKLNEERSFRHTDYFSQLTAQRVRNNPQPALSPRPIDFIAMRLPGSAAAQAHAENAYWLYGDSDKQLVILQYIDGDISVEPARDLKQDAGGTISWTAQAWRAGLPLQLFEDPNLEVPSGADRARWLCQRHSEREWLNAIHQCRYSNGVIGIVEQLSPVGPNVPGRPGISPALLSYERRRRELVEPDFQIFAADHWNFNARNFNPGGNHGSFFRISTHSVWMMAGAGVPVRTLATPYDSLNFASTVLSLVSKRPPLPDRVVELK